VTPTVLQHGSGYDLVVRHAPARAERHARLTLGLRCHTCQRISFHPKDIQERYCAACHVFHEDQRLDPQG
jgi:ribosomal protein L37E